MFLVCDIIIKYFDTLVAVFEARFFGSVRLFWEIGSKCRSASSCCLCPWISLKNKVFGFLAGHNRFMSIGGLLSAIMQIF